MIECCGGSHESNYCPTCGKLLKARIVECCGASRDSRYCPECGKNLPPTITTSLSHCRSDAGHSEPEPGQSGYNIYPDDYHGDTSIDSQDWDRNAYYHEGKRYIYGTGGPKG